MRHVLLSSLVVVLLAGCGSKLKRLSTGEQDHFYALRVYMDDSEEKQFLKGKTEADRDAYLQGLGLWERFYQYDAGIRELIIAGDVSEGWREDMVLMAWGPPYERRRTTGRPAERSEIFVYRFEVDKEGVVRVFDPKGKTAYKLVDRYQVEVFMDDQKATELRRKDDWE